MKTISNDNGRTVGATVHAFEAAGLGKAPFRFVAFEVRKYCACLGAPVQPGSSCDFCGEALMNCFVIESADKKRFTVGCNCVAKTGDAGLRKVVDRHIREARNKALHERQDALIARAKAVLPTIEAKLKAMPSLSQWRASRGETRWDSVTWYLANAGRKGCCEVARFILREAGDKT